MLSVSRYVSHVTRLFLAVVLFACPASLTAQTIDKGHRILLEHGLQFQGMVATYDPFHLGTFRDANFTTVSWIWNSADSWLGDPPGFPWARWVGNESQMPFNAEEAPYAANLLALQLGDEQNLNDPAIRAGMAAWYDNVRPRFPDTILYSNSYGGQVNDANLGAFITAARPDMLSFDTYPFTPTGPAYGSPTNLYGDMWRYRWYGVTYGLPLAMYTQTFHDYMTRDPSESEMRLNYFAGVAFGFTYFTTFTYNTGASSLFYGPGDSNPTPGYAQLTEIHRRLRKLSPALTRLVTADVCLINGKHLDTASGTSVNNPTPIGVQGWQFNKNDPYMRGWVITNLGSKNDGLNGDVWISWFKPLDECFDGPGYSNQVYFMITNGLTARDGSAADCRQEIKINFLFSDGVDSVDRLRQDTGEVEHITLPLIPGTGRHQLTIQYDGGTGELFKFGTGAPFVGVPDADPPAAVTAFSASSGLSPISLAWTNPADYDFTGTLIRRKEGSSPIDANDGQFVVDKFNIPGSSDTFVDTGAPRGVRYYYAAFAHDATPHYATAAAATGIRWAPGDFNFDSDVDLTDFEYFRLCYSGPNCLPTISGCGAADLDGDSDVDLMDFVVFRGCFNGSDRPPACP